MCAYRFLAYVDLLGTTYSAATIATGYGAHIAIPLLRSAVEGRVDDITEEEAREIMTNCMRVLFYRDARSLDKVCFACLTTMLGSDGVLSSSKLLRSPMLA